MKKFLLNSSCVPQLKVPNDRGLINTFKTYQTSLESELLKGESKRNLYPEILRLKDELQEQLEDFSAKLEEEKIVQKEGSDSDSEDEQEFLHKLAEEKTQWFLNIPKEAFSKNPTKLSDLCLEIFAKNFKKGPIPSQIQGSDFVKFGEILDINLPLLDTLEIDNDIYWKRVVDNKSHNRYNFEKLSRSNTTNWKRIGIELKFSEFIENLPAEDFEENKSQEILKNQKLYSLIENLSLRQLQPLKKLAGAVKYPEHKVQYVFNYECPHGSLQFIENFRNLKNISLVFGKKDIGMKYERRFFEVSYLDIRLLSSGLRHLNHLQTFTIQNSKLKEKLKILRLLTSLRKHRLKKLELSHCCLQDDTGNYFMKFFEINKSLEELELAGNFLGAKVCNNIGIGLSKFQGTLKYLGLSGNPVTEDGFLALGAGVKDTLNLEYLDISLCDVGTKGCKRIVQFIDFHKPLKKINFSNIHFTDHYGNRLVNMLIGNFNIEDIECRCCNLSHDQMLNIKILLARNKYYRENPVLLKSAPWSEEDEMKAEMWLKADKHPLNIKHKKNYEESLKKLKERIERDKPSIVNTKNLDESFLQNHFKIA